MTDAADRTQRGLYGRTWAERFTQIRDAYGLTQAGVAATVGLSAPMVSQLVTGQRLKISNPVVLARVVSLEEHLADPGVAARDAVRIAAVLAQVRESQPTLTTQGLTVAPREAVVGWLRIHGNPRTLAALGDQARSCGAAELADVLDEATADPG